MAGVKSMNSPLVKDVRGRGLFMALELVHDANVDGADFTDILREENGCLTKATQTYVCRLTPALCITEQQADRVLDSVADTLKRLETLNNSRAK